MVSTVSSGAGGSTGNPPYGFSSTVAAGATAVVSDVRSFEVEHEATLAAVIAKIRNFTEVFTPGV